MIGKGFNEGHFKWGLTPAWIGSLAPIMHLLQSDTLCGVT